MPKAFNIRSAYRNEPDFKVNTLQRVGPVYEHAGVDRMIENGITVSRNYHRLVSQTLANVFDRQHDELSVSNLRDRLIGEVRSSMLRVFDDLVLFG